MTAHRGKLVQLEFGRPKLLTTLPLRDAVVERVPQPSGVTVTWTRCDPWPDGSYSWSALCPWCPRRLLVLVKGQAPTHQRCLCGHWVELP